MNKADMNMIMTTSDFLQFRCTKLNLCLDLRVSHSTRITVHVHLRLYVIERVRACLTHHRGMDPLSLLSALDHMETDFVQRHQRYICEQPSSHRVSFRDGTPENNCLIVLSRLKKENFFIDC